MLVNWPLAAGGFTLQQASNLEAASWVNNTNSVEIIGGGSNVVTNDSSAATLYFRVRK
jgi:UDP-N-acetylenolpyruvoylglucosamine reductase